MSKSAPYTQCRNCHGFSMNNSKIKSPRIPTGGSLRIITLLLLSCQCSVKTDIYHVHWCNKVYQ